MQLNKLDINMQPLKIESISKSFNKNKVLDDISFEVKKEEIFGLIGLNGVGKTTLIKIILDLLKADAGNAQFFDKNVTSFKSRNKIAYLPEKFYPSQYLKGVEFLKLSMSFFNKELDIEEMNNKAQILELRKEALNLTIKNYSKGMGQKLGLLSMFLSNVPLLILDEPMSGLDPSARLQLKDLLLSYKKEGNTIFFSSHILSDIEEICDRMAVMHDGKLIYVGEPKKFLTKYKEKNLERAFIKAIK